MIMVIYETIWNFLMLYIFRNPYGSTVDSMLENSTFWSDLMSFTMGTDGRYVWTPVFDTGLYVIYELVAHILTIIACVSLCVMLWKLITLPIKWAIKRAE